MSSLYSEGVDEGYANPLICALFSPNFVNPPRFLFKSETTIIIISGMVNVNAIGNMLDDYNTLRVQYQYQK